MRHVFDSFAGFDDFLAYLGLSLVLTGLFLAIYVRITPYREFALIREGNMAASFSLSGSLLGFVIPLSAAVKYSVSLVDMAIWGLVALVIQVAAFVAVKLVIPTLPRDIPEGKGAQGFFLGSLSLAVGILSAACMSF